MKNARKAWDLGSDSLLPPFFKDMSADINSNYYIVTAYGGWSPCIEGNTQHGLQPFPGSVLPNCVGYTVGRFNELMAEGACTWLGSVAAKEMLQLAISQGLSSGDDPVVGGVICWDSDVDGHCAVIEEVVSPDDVITSESGWTYTSAPIVRTQHRYRVGGAWEFMSGYTYQGIIYPPHAVGDDLNGWYLLFHNGGIW